jgi:hypothetical protein
MSVTSRSSLLMDISWCVCVCMLLYYVQVTQYVIGTLKCVVACVVYLQISSASFILLHDIQIRSTSNARIFSIVCYRTECAASAETVIRIFGTALTIPDSVAMHLISNIKCPPCLIDIIEWTLKAFHVIHSAYCSTYMYILIQCEFYFVCKKLFSFSYL